MGLRVGCQECFGIGRFYALLFLCVNPFSGSEVSVCDVELADLQTAGVFVGRFKIILPSLPPAAARGRVEVAYPVGTEPSVMGPRLS